MWFQTKRMAKAELAGDRAGGNYLRPDYAYPLATEGCGYGLRNRKNKFPVGGELVTA